MKHYSTILLRFSAFFALLGAVIGSHMAGAGGYEFKTVHAHILVVGRKMYDEAQKLLDDLGVQVNAHALVRDLGVAHIEKA